MTGSSDRILGLDILRALAILLVMGSHWDNNFSIWFGRRPPVDLFASDLGVELFFALSGFLIGRIVFDIAEATPTWRSLGVFLARRWLRTLPAYYAWLLLLALCFPPPPGRWLAYVARFATMTQNLLQPMPRDYWFSVAWTLGVEEWFYLLFGVGALAGAILLRRAWGAWIALALLLIAPPILRLGTPAYVDFASGVGRMVPFRLDEIGYGVVLAVLCRRRRWWLDRPVWPLLLGVVLIAAAWGWWLPVPFPLWVALRNQTAVIGCALCMPAALRIRAAPRWVASAARHLSRLSYALYLVHGTIMADLVQELLLARHRVSAAEAAAISVAGAFVAAELLSRCIEQPFMARRPPQQSGRIRSDPLGPRLPAGPGIAG